MDPRNLDQARLTDEQITVALHLCFKNAEKLSRDADLLSASGSVERGISLMILSLEELAKIPLIFGALNIAPDNASAWKRFWRSWRSHSAKQTVWSIYGDLLSKDGGKEAEIYSERYPPDIDIDGAKQRGFYVAFRNGNFESPEEFARVDGESLLWLRGFLLSRIESFRALHGEIELSRNMVTSFRMITLDPAGWSEETKAVAAQIRSKHGDDFFEQMRKLQV